MDDYEDQDEDQDEDEDEDRDEDDGQDEEQDESQGYEGVIYEDDELVEEFGEDVAFDNRQEFEISDDEDDRNAQQLLLAPQAPPVSRRRGASTGTYTDPSLLHPNKRVCRENDSDSEHSTRNPVQVSVFYYLKLYFSI